MLPSVGCSRADARHDPQGANGSKHGAHCDHERVQVREYFGSESNTYYIVMSGTDHMSFTDSPLILSRFARDSKVDNGAFERAVLTTTLTRSLVEEFFSKYLKGDRAPHLDVVTHVDRK